MLGIDNIVKLSAAAGSSITVVDGVFGDRNLSLGDLSELPKGVKVIKDLIEIDYKSVLPEIKDLEENEKEALASAFAKNLKLENLTMEAILESGFALIVEFLDLVAGIAKWGAKAK